MSIEYIDVHTCHEKFGMLHPDKPTHVTKRKLVERWEFMKEELSEFKAAVTAQDMPSMADALVDLVYVAIGTAVQMGLPWDKLWDDVQRANMAKERGIGKRGNAVDLVKPPGWVGPRTEEILATAGYDRGLFTEHGSPTSRVLESKCLDDLVHLEKNNA